MTAQSLNLNHHVGVVHVSGLIGTVSTQIGGDFHRETVSGASSAGNPGMNRATSIAGRAFATHVGATVTGTMRIYEFDPDAYYVPVGTYGTSQANFHAFEAGDTWSTDGGSTTGTFVEDGVSTDTYVLVKFTTGSPNLNNTDTITITSGTANTETAVATADAAQGGGAGEEGEWKAVLTSSIATIDPFSCSGLHSLNISGKMGSAVCWKQQNSTNIYGYTYDVETNTWTDHGVISTAVASTYNIWGTNRVVSDTIYAGIEGANLKLTTIAFNPSTLSVGIQTSADNISDEVYSYSANMGVFGGKFLLLTPQASGGVGQINLCTLSGGNWGILDTFRGSSSAADLLYWISGGAGTTLFEHYGKLWGFAFSGVQSTSANTGYGVLAFTEKNGVITCDNLDDVATDVTGDNSVALAQYLLSDPVMAPGTPSAGSSARQQLRLLRRQITNDPDGDDIIDLHYISDHKNTGTSTILSWGNPFTDLNGTLTIDWSTQADQGSDIWRLTTTSGNPETALAIGDWIGLTSDGQIFRVTARNNASSYVEIHNPASRTLPTAATASRTLTGAIPTTGIASSVGFTSQAADNTGGGAHYFSKGTIAGVITSSEGISATKQRISLMFFGGGTVDCELFHGDAGDGIANATSTITKPAGQTWTLNGTVMEGMTADGSTTYLVDHDFDADGLAPGEVTRRVLKVTVG